MSYSRAAICEEKTLESIIATAPVYLEKELKAVREFCTKNDILMIVDDLSLIHI